MGPIRRAYEDNRANLPPFSAILDKADELIARLEARVAALEERSAPAITPAEPEKKFAIFLKGTYGTSWYYDRLDGFTSMTSERIHYPALFRTMADAESSIQALDLHGLGHAQIMDGEVYIGPASVLTD